MKVSVVIPTYKNWHDLKKCLDALSTQSLHESEYEVIVVNNDPGGDIPDWLGLPKRWKLALETKPGSYAARNKGAEMAEGEIIAFTDSDCIPDRNWLKQAVNKFDRRLCDLIGGEVEIFRAKNGKKLPWLYEREFAFKQSITVEQGKSVTANLFIKKEVFEKMGGFNTSIKSMGDWLFTGQCHDAGYKIIYDPDCIVRHPARRTFRKLMKRSYRITCWREVLIRDEGYSNMVVFKKIIGGFLSKTKKNTSEAFKKNKFFEAAQITVVAWFLALFQLFIRGAIFFKVIEPQSVRE